MRSSESLFQKLNASNKVKYNHFKQTLYGVRIMLNMAINLRWLIDCSASEGLISKSNRRVTMSCMLNDNIMFGSLSLKITLVRGFA